jgi:hypothetical protein
MRMAQQFVLLIALGCTAAIWTLAGSALADLITVIDHRPVAIGVPAGEAIAVPAPVEQRPHSQEEASVPGSEPVMDLYGNEVADAVAKYRLDSRGAPYEEHTPQTEVPRLAAPKS